MNFKENEYREIRNTDLNRNIPVKILKVNEFDIKIKDLIENTEYEINRVSQVRYPSRRPHVNNKMIVSCGFKKISESVFTFNNIAIIKCPFIKYFKTSRNIEEKHYNFYGYKILLRNDVSEFKKNYTETIHKMTLTDLQEKNDTVFSAEDFFKKLTDFGLTNIDFEKLLIEQCIPY